MPLLMIFISCKKSYICVCTNPYIDPSGFEIKAKTKIQAKSDCKKYLANGELNYQATSCYITK